MPDSEVKITFPIGNWDKLREWLEDGTTPLSASVVRYLLAERDALFNALKHAIDDERRQIIKELEELQVRRPGGPYIDEDVRRGIDWAIGAIEDRSDATH